MGLESRQPCWEPLLRKEQMATETSCFISTHNEGYNLSRIVMNLDT